MRPGLAILFVLWSTAVIAQPAQDRPQPPTAAQPMITVTLEPPTVLVGRPVRVRIRALAPNFLTQPAQFPDLQIVNAVTRPAGQTSISGTRDGLTFAGVMADYDIYPQEPGRFALASATVTLVYAEDPPRSATVHLTTPSLTFTATIPVAGRGLAPFLATPQMSLTQTLEPAGSQFGVGDAVTRTIIAEAVDLPAIFLPAIRATAPDGIAAYPAQPTVEDRPGERGATGRGRRTEQVTYTFERAGDFALPAIALDWWNSETGRVEHATLPGFAVHVAAAAGRPAGDDPQRLRRTLLGLRDHWLAILAVTALAAAAIILVRPLAGRLVAWNAARRQRETGSERHAYRALQRAAREGSAKDTYTALLAWLDRHPPDGAMALRDKVQGGTTGDLARQIDLLERRLYGKGEATRQGWSGRGLIAAVRTTRRAWRAAPRPGVTQALPVSLNPGGKPA